MKELIERLERERDLTNAEFAVLLDQSSGADRDFLFERARAVRDAHYGRKVYIRGLIELTNYCKNDCLYCGIRKSNTSCERYRLTKEQILSCCESGYALGFRTFVLQGGEDGWYTDERMTDIVRAMRQAYPDCAITLSLGERGRESFKRLYDAGAKPLSAPPRNRGRSALRQASSSFHDADASAAMPAGLEGDRFSDRRRFHGRLTLSDDGVHRAGLPLFAGVEAADGGAGPFHSAPRHAA